MSILSILANSTFLLGVIVVIATALVVVFLSYLKLSEHFRDLLAERDALKNNTDQNTQVVIEEARRQARSVLERAQEKAEKILADTEAFHVDAKRIFDTELKDVTASQAQEIKKASEQLIKNYEASLSHMRDEDINLVKNITESIEKDVTENMKDFKLELQKETVASKQIVQQKLDQEYLSAKGEIDQYKKEQLAKVDEHILDLVKRIASLTIKKSLSLEDHQELVLEAMTEAKKEIEI